MQLFHAYQKRGMAKNNAVTQIVASLGIAKKDVWDFRCRIEGHV